MDLINSTPNCESDLKVETVKTEDEKVVPSLSKRQMKKLKRSEKWQSEKTERRKKEKEKRKLKKQNLRLSGQYVGRQELTQKLIPMKESPNRVMIVIDCDFEDMMTEIEMRKLIKQIHRCYSLNKNSRNPCQLYLTSIKGKIKETLEHLQSGYVNWDINCSDKNYQDIFSERKNDVIYLTSDSENVIENVDSVRKSDKIFVIGGLVDHNRYKGFCYDLAVKNNINHARLPIDEHIKMTQRRVLTVNHGKFIKQIAFKIGY